MSIRVLHLIQNTNPVQVLDRIAFIYADQNVSRDEYLCMFQKLLHMQVKYQSASDAMIIEITLVPEDEYSDEYVDVSARYADMRDNEKYAIEFVPWAEWLTMEISSDSLALWGDVDCLAHIMWEMSFFSFDEYQIQKKFQELKVEVERAKEEIRDVRAKRIPLL